MWKAINPKEFQCHHGQTRQQKQRQGYFLLSSASTRFISANERHTTDDAVIRWWWRRKNWELLIPSEDRILDSFNIYFRWGLRKSIFRKSRWWISRKDPKRSNKWMRTHAGHGVVEREMWNIRNKIYKNNTAVIFVGRGRVLVLLRAHHLANLRQRVPTCRGRVGISRTTVRVETFPICNATDFHRWWWITKRRVRKMWNTNLSGFIPNSFNFDRSIALFCNDDDDDVDN